MLEPSTEVERLRRTYAGYRSSTTVQRRWSPENRGNQAILTERAEAVRALLARGGLLPLAGRRVLDVGCGSGDVLASLVDRGAQPRDLYGVDLCEENVARARAAYPAMAWQCGNGETLDFPSGFFGLVLSFTVFSSILDRAMARNVAAEIRRVLDRDGALVWYDFRYGNPYNRAVRGMSLAGVRALFPGWQAEMRSITVLPPLARRLGRATPLLYPALARVPPLRSHLVGLLRRPAAEHGTARAERR